MTRRHRNLWIALAGVLVACVTGWAARHFFHRRGGEAVGSNRFQVRASRRAYDGAPPVIPHPPLGGACTTCHTTEARILPGVGIAPPNPHLHTEGMSASSRCQQCHVFTKSDGLFVETTFEGLAQLPRRGERMYPHAPPVIPHHDFMREDCNACHSGTAARKESQCSHPERARCLQCHATNSSLR
jgi:cytochrome c-type protein NapB